MRTDSANIDQITIFMVKYYQIRGNILKLLDSKDFRGRQYPLIIWISIIVVLDAENRLKLNKCIHKIQKQQKFSLVLLVYYILENYRCIFLMSNFKKESQTTYKIHTFYTDKEKLMNIHIESKDNP